MKTLVTTVLILTTTSLWAQKDVKVSTTKNIGKATAIKQENKSASDNLNTKQISSNVNLTSNQRLKKVDIESPGNEVSGASVRKPITGYAQSADLVTITITPTITSYPPYFYLTNAGANAAETKTFAPVIQKVTADFDGNWKTAPVYFGVDGNQEDASYRIEAVTSSGKAIQKVKNLTRATHAPALITSNTDGQQLPGASIIIPKGTGTPGSAVSVNISVYAMVKIKQKTGLFQQFINFTTPVLNIVKTGETISDAFNKKSNEKLAQYSIYSETITVDANGNWNAKGALLWPPDLMRKGIQPFAATVSVRPTKNASPNSYLNSHTIRVELK